MEEYFVNPNAANAGTMMPAPQQMALERWRRQLNNNVAPQTQAVGEASAAAANAATAAVANNVFTQQHGSASQAMWGGATLGGVNPAAATPYFNMSYMLQMPPQMQNLAMYQHQLNMAAFAAAQQQQQRKHPQSAPRKNSAKKQPQPVAPIKSPPVIMRPTLSDTSAATSHKEISDDDEGAELAASLDKKNTASPQNPIQHHVEEDEKEKVPQKVVIEKAINDESLPKPVPGKICAYCRAQKTPLWRNGPFGAKTLCNACGVRYKLGKLAGTEDGYVVNVILPRQKRRKRDGIAVPSSKVDVSAATESEAIPSSGVEAPLKVRNTVSTKRIHALREGLPKVDSPLRISSPFLANDYDGASLLMVLAGENDKKKKIPEAK